MSEGCGRAPSTAGSPPSCFAEMFGTWSASAMSSSRRSYGCRTMLFHVSVMWCSKRTMSSKPSARRISEIRRALGFEDIVRFEHHITETWKSIVLQPYDRREELMALADHVPNISAKHEGGDPAVDGARPHPSDILDYFREKSEVIASGDWESLALNFMDKLDATNHTARALTEHALSFVAARNLHR